MVPGLKITTFGTLTIEHDGALVKGLASQKAAALLVYLACTRQAHPRELLADLLWDDLPLARGRGNLSVLLSSLRQQLGAYLRIDRASVAFNAELRHTVDAVELETRVQRALQHASAALDHASAQTLEHVLELYQGEFLHGFALRDSPRFEDWALGEQKRFQQMVGAARRALIASYLHHGDYAAGMVQARALLQLDALDEEAHRQLMLLLAYSGQRGAALAQYDVCRRTLRAELDIAPDPATTALFEQIRSALPAATPRAALPIQHAPLHAPLGLPADLTPLLGRASELEHISALVRHGDHRLITLIGQGGVGKTRLALAAATQLRHHFADGVWWVPLVGISAPAPADTQAATEIAAAIVGTLGLALDGAEDTATQCIRVLHHKQLLLVCDNFEHLLAGAEFLQALLRGAPHVRLLVTSRERLNLAAERAVQVAGLSLPPNDDPRGAPIYAAVALFLERAAHVARDFGRDEATLRAVIRLCRVLDGVPLGIELAAQWVADYSCDEIAHAVSTNFDFLTTSARGYPERHRSMRGIFSYSWNLLADEERQVLAQLSVFHGTFERAAASGIVGDAVSHAAAPPHPALAATLAALVDKSLLHRAGTGRYSMHELLRQFAAERLAHTPETHARTLARHAAYYLGWIVARTAELAGPLRQTALAAIEANLENIYAAWSWAAAQCQVALIAQSITAVCRFYHERGRYQEGEALCELVIVQLDPAQAAADAALALGHALAWKAAFAIGRSQLPDARALLQQSLALLDAPEAASARAFALFCRGQVALLGSDLAEARRWLDDSLRLYQAQRDQAGTAQASNVLGRIAWLAGDYAAAQRWYQNTLAIYRALGHQTAIVYTLSDVAMTTVLLGQSHVGVQLLHESRALAQHLGDRREIARAYRSLSEVFTYIGHHTEAQMLLEACVEIDDTFGLASLGAQDRMQLALVHLAQCHYDAVLMLGPPTLSMSRALGLHRNVGFMLALLGLAELGRGAYYAAHDLLQESLIAYQVAHLADDTIVTFFGLSQVYRVLGARAQARQMGIAALRLAAKGRGVRAELFAIGAMVAVYVVEQQIEAAVELAALVAQHPLGSNVGFLSDLVRQPVVAFAAELPAEVIAAARTRGQARDLSATVAALLAQSDTLI